MPAVKDYHSTKSQFCQYKASEKLLGLAEHPYDLTKERSLSPQRLAKYVSESCGYKFLYGTERIDDNTMSALMELAKEAKVYEKMKDMQSGKVINKIDGFPSENRSVLHTAARDFFDNPQTAPEAKEAAQLAKNEVDKLKDFIAKIDRENRFTDLIAIGIGGSDLGPKATYLALESLLKPGRRVHFICNVDPDDAAAVVKGLDLKHCLVTVVSKAGKTLETQTNEEIVRAYFKKAGLSPEGHFIAITAKGSPMDDPKKYLACFHLWDWIGGRYSTTSMVGGVMLSFAFGFNVFWELLKGANAMDKAALNTDIHHNIPLLGALLSIWNHNFLGYPTLALIPYSQALLRYPAHIQQVEMESNGKRIDRHGVPVDFETGPIIWGEPGTNAQHSFYQLIHQGTATIPLEFIGFKETQRGEDLEFEGTTSQEKLLSNLFAQAIALATGQQSDNPNKVFPGNRPSHILLAKKLTPYTLGALLAYFEHKVAFEGFIWDINSFDQEGVQLGKVLANKIIGRFAARKNPKLPNEPYPLADAFIKQLDNL